MAVYQLPRGLARETYLAARAIGKTQASALKQAAEVEACADEFHCAKCGAELDVRKNAKIRYRADGTRLEVWCEGCAVTVPKWKK